MATQYSRLQLKVHAPLKIKDLTFKVTLTNSATKKTVFSYEGAFDKKGFTKWIHIFQPNRSLIYEVLYRGDVIQRISAKAYSNMNNWSFFDFKTTSELTKKVKENIKEIHLNDGEVAWYLIKKPETVLAWSNRVFKKPLAPSDWDTLRANNPHLSSLVAVGVLKPGWIIILSNSTTAKALPEYKKHAKAAFKNLEEMQKDKDFDALFFAQNYEFIYDVLKNKNTRVVKKDIFENDHPLTVKFNRDKKDEGFFEQKMIPDAALLMIEAQVHRIYKLHGELTVKYEEANIKGTPNASTKFGAFREQNIKIYKEFNQESVKKFFRWDQNIKTSNMRKMLNQSVLSRDNNYKGGTKEYAKKMGEVGKFSKYLKGVGYLSVAIDVANSGVAVYEAAPEDKARTTVVETVKTGTALVSGVYASALIIGLATGGVGLVVIGIVAISAPMAGKAVSEIAGWGVGKIYDSIENNTSN